MYINISQEPTTSWLSIFPDPADGVSINAFSLEAGHPNGVCSGTSRRFTVTLKDPKLRYKVTTTFNQLLDLRITPTNHLEDNRSTDAMAIAVYNRKAAKYYSPEQLTQYTNQVSSLESGTSFYLNPFRTGPGDPAILGTVTVTAFDPTNPNAELSESAKLTFNVEIKASTNYVLDDIIVGNLLIADNARTEIFLDKRVVVLADALGGQRNSLFAHGVHIPLKLGKHGLAVERALVGLHELVEDIQLLVIALTFFQLAMGEEQFVDRGSHLGNEDGVGGVLRFVIMGGEPGMH